MLLLGRFISWDSLFSFVLAEFVNGFLKSERPFVQLFPKHVGGLAESDSREVE